MIYAFIDDNDGYYEIEVLQNQSLPEWTKQMTPTTVRDNSTPRAVFERQAKQKFDALIMHAVDILNQLRGDYAFGSTEHTYLTTLRDTLLTLSTVTDLSAATSVDTAYTILFNAYAVAVAGASPILKARYAVIVRQRRSAGIVL